ncbi:isoprenyl transferase [bacterium]|nr:isoprenyl transferase [candidate division CSSED10-310 bacterium]
MLNNKNQTDPTKSDPDRMPVHIAIIMDGNGRWARARGLPRVAGHRAGVKTVDRIMEDAVSLGIKVLTLYTFSTENWKRPRAEVGALMELLYKNLLNKRKKLIDNDVRLRISGDISNFPGSVKKEVMETIAATDHCKTMIMNLALGYSGRDEIVKAAQSLARLAVQGDIQPENIDELLFSRYLSTGDLPDPDLVIRTSGEYRVSNFLLWQASYAEYFFTDVLWPDFNRQNLVEAIQSFQRRERRFGGLSGKDRQS